MNFAVFKGEYRGGGGGEGGGEDYRVYHFGLCTVCFIWFLKVSWVQVKRGDLQVLVIVQSKLIINLTIFTTVFRQSTLLTWFSFPQFFFSIPLHHLKKHLDTSSVQNWLRAKLILRLASSSRSKREKIESIIVCRVNNCDPTDCNGQGSY